MHLTLYSHLILLIVFLSPLALPLPVPSSPSSDSLISRDLNSFLARIILLFHFSGTITEISNLITAASVLLASLTGTQTSQNDIVSGNACAAITVIFARGTTEPGNVGVLVGPPFFNALESLAGAGNVALQGVDYPASVEGFLAGGDAAGSQTMANLVTKAFSMCPSSKIVMGGYSQGGQLVHKAAALLPDSTMKAVSSVVIFGDPDDGQVVANVESSKTLVICHETDDICLHGDLILLAHLTYAKNAMQAASFVAGLLGS